MHRFVPISPTVLKNRAIRGATGCHTNGGGQGNHLSLIPRKKHQVTPRFLSHRVTYCSFLGVETKRAAITTGYIIYPHSSLFYHRKSVVGISIPPALSSYARNIISKDYIFSCHRSCNFFFSALARKAGQRVCLSITAG